MADGRWQMADKKLNIINLTYYFMKYRLSIILACLFMAACQTQPHYTIDGSIGGECEGAKVKLTDLSDYYNPVVIDSTFIQTGKFHFSGAVESPTLYQLLIDRTPKGEDPNPKHFLVTTFYLENSPINISSHVDSMSTYYWSKEKYRKPARVEGSAMEDLHRQYKQEIASISSQLSKLNEEYLEQYHRPSIEGIFNTAQGIALSRQMQSLEKQRDKLTLNFIRNHPETIVGYNLASQQLEGMYVNLSVPQIQELNKLITEAWQAFPEKADHFREIALQREKIALGVHYPDIELTNTAGETVKLSQYVPEGKYVLLEFWASWCGPCRGEIPHLRHVYEEYRALGFEIVSVSIDEKDADWQKAMEEEGMSWPQLCDPKGFKGPVTDVYNITGVPSCFLLDKEGRIFKTDMRGAAIDAVLEDLLHKN